MSRNKRKLTEDSWCSETLYPLRMLQMNDSLNILWATMNDSGSILVEEQLFFRDRISLQKFQWPCRGVLCDHVLCFDYEVYLQFNKGRHSLSDYKCPLCNKSCNSSKLYVDPIHYLLLHSVSTDSVYILSDGRIRQLDRPLAKSTSEVIDLDMSQDECMVVSDIVNESNNEDKTIPIVITALITHNSTINIDVVTLEELCVVSLDDVVQHLNSSESDEMLLKIPFINKVGKTMLDNIIKWRPFVCTSYQGLRSSLWLIDGIGPHRTASLIDEITKYLKNVFDKIAQIPTHQFKTLAQALDDISTKNSASVLIESALERDIVDLTEGDEVISEMLSPSISAVVPSDVPVVPSVVHSVVPQIIHLDTDKPIEAPAITTTSSSSTDTFATAAHAQAILDSFAKETHFERGQVYGDLSVIKRFNPPSLPSVNPIVSSILARLPNPDIITAPTLFGSVPPPPPPPLSVQNIFQRDEIHNDKNINQQTVGNDTRISPPVSDTTSVIVASSSSRNHSVISDYRIVPREESKLKRKSASSGVECQHQQSKYDQQSVEHRKDNQEQQETFAPRMPKPTSSSSSQPRPVPQQQQQQQQQHQNNRSQFTTQYQQKLYPASQSKGKNSNFPPPQPKAALKPTMLTSLVLNNFLEDD